MDAESSDESTLQIQIPDDSEMREYIDKHMSMEVLEERAAITQKMGERAGGVRLWAEMVTIVVNDAAEDGVAGEVILSMLDDITPVRQKGSLDCLYAWKLRRLSTTERPLALVVMQWVMLAPEPLRLNELLVALRITLLHCRRERGQQTWDTNKVLNVEPAMSLKDLRKSALDGQGLGTAMDSPALFWKWLRHISQGLLKLESSGGGAAGAAANISSEPLGLQRVRPVHESVQDFFLRGKGFQTLSPTPKDPTTKPPPTTDDIIDTSYYALLHVCLTYLNSTDLDTLGREKKKPTSTPLSPGTNLPPRETSTWRQHAAAQRKMVIASFPFLRYAVDNLVFHLLAPRAHRYFLPQHDLLRLLAANRCRIWRRWTHLLGLGLAEADAPAVLAAAAQPAAAKGLLDPVYGARWRLERVLRKVWRLAVEQGGGGGGGVGTPSPRRTHFRSRSEGAERTVVFMMMGVEGDAPPRERAAQWLAPTPTMARVGRARASSSPAVARVPLTFRALSGIQEVG